MPPRACHSVPLFLAAVCGGRERPSELRSGQGFLRSCSGSPSKSPQCTAARSRRSLPDVGLVLDPRSPWAAPAGSPRHRQNGPGHQGEFGQPLPVSRAKTNWRAAPSICLAVKGSPSTGQRSRSKACSSAPVNGSEVFNRSGSSKRGSWMSAVLKVGAPGRAWSDQSSQNAACSDREVGPRRSARFRGGPGVSRR